MKTGAMSPSRPWVREEELSLSSMLDLVDEQHPRDELCFAFLSALSHLGIVVLSDF